MESGEVVWTEGARRKLPSRRDREGGKRPARPDLNKLATKLLAEWNGRPTFFGAYRSFWFGSRIEDCITPECWTRGEAHASERCAGWMRAVREKLAALAAGDRRLEADPEIEAACAVMLGIHEIESPAFLADYWTALGGADFALDVLIRSFRLSCNVDGEHDRRPRSIWLVEGPPRWPDGLASSAATTHSDERWDWMGGGSTDRVPPQWPPLELTPWSGPVRRGSWENWERLRRHLAVAPDVSYLRARDLAARQRPSAPLQLRCALSYAFPTELSWSLEDAREALSLLEAPAGGWSSYRTWNLQPAMALLTNLTDASLAERLARRYVLRRLRGLGFPPRFLIALVECVGVDAEGLLEWMLTASEKKPSTQAEYTQGDWLDLPVDEKRGVAEALALIVNPRTMRFFARGLDNRALRGLAAGALRRNPRLSIPALGQHVAEHLRSEEAKLLLAALKRSLPGADGMGAPPVVEASADVADLPLALSLAPWRRPRTPPKWPRLEVAMVSAPERVHWQDGEREGILASPPPRNPLFQESGDPHIIQHQLPHLAERGCWKYYRINHAVLDEVLAYAVARFESACLPGLLALLEKVPRAAVKWVLRAESVRVAPHMASLFFHPTVGWAARLWIRRYPETAALGLVPMILGMNPDAAARALLHLALLGRRDAVELAAERYGPAARQPVGDLLSSDVLDIDLPKRAPRLPPFWSPAQSSRPVLRASGQRLSDAPLTHLVEMLAFSPLDPAYAGLLEVKQACDEASLERFAWSVFESWLVDGAPAEEAWALRTLGHFGTDDTTRRLAAMALAWPGEGASARAAAALDVLAAIGTDVALMELHNLAFKAKFKGLRDRAAARIEQLAEERGLSLDELADRAVPALDLDADGSKLLEFGAQRFRVGFDEQLQPYVSDATQTPPKKLARLSRPNDQDDADEAAAAAAVWRQLRKDAVSVVKTQVRRLEKAMCTRRRWPAESFRLFFLNHPLMVHLARRLVWSACDQEGRVLGYFRVAEDSSLSDSDERSFLLPSDSQAGIPHPVEMSAEALAGWAQILADYRIVQPFPQVGRMVYRVTERERGECVLRRWEGRQVPWGGVFALSSRGWKWEPPTDGLYFQACFKLVGSGLRAHLTIEPGIMAQNPHESERQTLGSISLTTGHRHSQPAAAHELDVLEFSELLSDVMNL